MGITNPKEDVVFNRSRYSSGKSARTHLRNDRAPLRRGTHGEMDRFLQEVSDEAHSGGHASGGSSH
jgi:hypothetical protein